MVIGSGSLIGEGSLSILRRRIGVEPLEQLLDVLDVQIAGRVDRRRHRGVGDLDRLTCLPQRRRLRQVVGNFVGEGNRIAALVRARGIFLGLPTEPALLFARLLAVSNPRNRQQLHMRGIPAPRREARHDLLLVLGREQWADQNQVRQTPFQRGKRLVGRSDHAQRAADTRAENPLEDGCLRCVRLDGESVRVAGLVGLIARLFGHGLLAHQCSVQWQFGYQLIFTRVAWETAVMHAARDNGLGRALTVLQSDGDPRESAPRTWLRGNDARTATYDATRAGRCQNGNGYVFGIEDAPMLREPANDRESGGNVRPGFEDGLGRRYRPAARLDSEAPLEILCFRREITDVPAFEFALRERVARFSDLQHPSFTRIRKVDRLNDEHGTVVLMSDGAVGVRLIDILSEVERSGRVLDLNTALSVVRQLISAIAALHRHARVAHGAIAPERLYVTPRGRVLLVEYALGAALEQLKYSRERYWKELRVALPMNVGLARFDERADLTQVGVVALSLIIGRPFRDDEYPRQLEDLLAAAQVRDVNGSHEALPATLQEWLKRALQLDARSSFRTIFDAEAALDDVLTKEARYNAAPSSLEAFMERYDRPAPAAAPGFTAKPAPPPSIPVSRVTLPCRRRAPTCRRPSSHTNRARSIQRACPMKDHMHSMMKRTR